MEGSANEFGSIGAALPGFFLALFWLLSKLMNRSIGYTNGVFLLLFFCIWMITTFFWSRHQYVTLNAIFSYTMIFVFYWLVSDTIRKQEDFLLAIACYVAGLLLLSMTAITNIADDVGYGGLYNRYSADGTDPNNFGMMLVTSLPLLVILCLLTKKILHIAICIIIFIFFSYLILSTASRTASISLMLVLIISPLILSRNLKSFVVNVTIAFVVLLALEAVGGIIPENALERLFSGFVILGADERFLVWKDILYLRGIEIFGIGAGATYAEIGIQAHNTFFSALFEAGLLGFILWALFWLHHILSLFSLRQRSNMQIRNLLLLTLLLLFVASVTLNWEFRKPLFFILALTGKWVILVSFKTQADIKK
jgi:hypothetical protein